jgi:hypothetical protein
MHGELGAQQQRLVQQVFSMQCDGERSRRYAQGVEVYQRNLVFTAAQSLTITYPVIAQLIGRQALTYLARSLLQYEQPLTGDWADWGSGLGDAIRATSLAVDFPYLADVAQLEWLVHNAGRVRVDDIDAPSFELLGRSSLHQLKLQLSPAVGLLTSEHPVAEIWRLHTSSTVPEGREASGHHWVVCQHFGLPVVRAISIAEFRWLEAVLTGLNLEQLLDRYPAFDFSQWLADAIQQNLLFRITHQRVLNTGENLP